MVDAAWLTGVLRRSGALADGSVTSITVTDTGAFNSTTVFVTARYRAAPPELPARLVVKRPTEAAWSRSAAVEEAAFYRRIADRPSHPPVLPRCFAAGDDHLVLEDLSATHRAPVTRDDTIALHGVPARGDLLAAVGALARLHRFWWDRDPAGFPVADWWGDDDLYAAYAEHRRTAWRAVRPSTPPDLRDVYDVAFAGLDAFGAHLRTRRGGPLTLIHGDAYLSNFLISDTGDARLIDWQSPSFDMGALDLVNMCATWWTADQRPALESVVLDHYHAVLDRSDYPMSALRADYRLALADWLLVPVQDAADGSAPSYWLPKMRCLVAAYHDHGVASLFGHGP